MQRSISNTLSFSKFKIIQYIYVKNAFAEEINIYFLLKTIKKINTFLYNHKRVDE